MTYWEGYQLSKVIDNLRAAANILEDLYFRGKGGYTTTEINCDRTEPCSTEGTTTCTD